MNKLDEITTGGGRLASTNLINYNTLGDPALERTIYIPASKRALIIPSIASDEEYTVEIHAYRVVDPDVDSTGIIKSASTTAPSSPYKPEDEVAFAGNIVGTINNIPAEDINVWDKVQGSAGVNQLIINAQAAAAAAQISANAAQAAADVANTQITNIASDNILSKSEKSDVILNKNTIDSEIVAIRASADNFLVSRVAYDAAYSALGTYLTDLGASNEWSDVTKDTVIVGTTFRTKFTDYYTARQSLLNSVTDKAKTLADAAQISANTANTAAGAAQTSANTANTAAATAQSAANAANASIANITSDNVLSMAEKPIVILNKNAVEGELVDIRAKADLFTVSRVAYDAAYTALNTYLAGLSPAYDSVTTDTVIVGATFRTKFTDYYSAKQSLLNSISAKAKTLVDAAQSAANTANTAAGAAQTSANTANTAAGTAQTAANTANAAASAAQTSANTANASIADIASDNILSKGEKSQVILDWNAISGEQAGIDAQAVTFSVSRTAYDTAVTALSTYLTGLGASNAWSDVTKDTVIVGATFRTKFTDVYTARQTLLNAIATKAATAPSVVIGGANLFPDGGFERNIYPWSTRNSINQFIIGSYITPYAGTKCLFFDSAATGTGLDMYTMSLGTPTTVVPGKQYVYSFMYATATNATITASSTYLHLSNGTYVSVPLPTLNTGGVWTLCELLWTCPAGVTSIEARFGVVCNAYTWMGVDCIQVEEGNKRTQWKPAQVDIDVVIANAQSTADAANASIANIASDNILSKGEKSQVILDWNAISGEQAGIDAQADALSISRTVYDTALNALANYLVAIGPGNEWSDTTKDSIIVGATFRTKFTDYYTAKQVLLNAIVGKASTVADWGGVSGRPLDSTNLVLTPSFDTGKLGTWSNSAGASLQANGVITSGMPSLYFMQTTVRDTIENNYFPVVPGEKFYVSAFVYTGNVNYQMGFGLVFYDSSGAILTFGTGASQVSGVASWVKTKGSLTVPANAVSAAPWVQIAGFSNLGTLAISNMIITRSEPGATVGATWGVDVNGSSAVDQQVTNAQNAANAAQTSANVANAEIGNISSDNVLSKSEKSRVLSDWYDIANEVTNIQGQADAFAVSRVNYDTAYQNLSSYLIGIGPGNSGWFDTTVNSSIDGNTFRSKWNSYYSARITILNAITTKAKTLADAGAATNAAAIVTESTARSGGDFANANLITNLTSTVNGNTASINQNVSSIQGVQANYGIKINNNGYVSGFGLLSQPINGAIVSKFNILADSFAIQAPNLNGGTPVVPFSVDTTTTPATISMNGLVRFGGSTDGTGGKNVLFNSGPSKKTISGYYVGYNSIGVEPIFGQSFDPWRPKGMGGVYTQFAGSPTGTCDIVNTNNTNTNYYPVVPGSKYEASAYLSVHRARADIAIVFYDSAGGYITEYHGNSVAESPDVNAFLNSSNRASVICTAPSNAVFCYVMIRTYYTGQLNPYTFSSMWYFGQAGINQTVPSPWSPSGVTTIDGGMIETTSLSAISATIGVLETRGSGARVQIRDDVIKVFNDSNIAKVKIGNLNL